MFKMFSYQPRRARLIALLCGALLFLWLRVEDNHTLPAALAGFGGTSVGLLLWLWRALNGRMLDGRVFLLGSALLGGVIGLLSAVVTALLMLLKNGSHGHVFPDYPFGVIADTLARAPAWGLAGLLIGVGLGLMLWALFHTSNGDSAQLPTP